MNIEITKEDEAYIKQQILDRYIDKQVEKFFHDDDFDNELFLKALTDRFKILVDQGRYDKEIDKAFKEILEDGYIGEFFNYDDVMEPIKTKILSLFK